MNTDLNIRGRITIKGLERCTPKMNSFLTEVWGATPSLLPSRWWVGLLKRLIPLSDKREAGRSFPDHLSPGGNSCLPSGPLQC